MTLRATLSKWVRRVMPWRSRADERTGGRVRRSRSAHGAHRSPAMLPVKEPDLASLDAQFDMLSSGREQGSVAEKGDLKAVDAAMNDPAGSG